MTERYPTIARLSDLTASTIGYQGPELVRESVACRYALATAEQQLAEAVKLLFDIDCSSGDFCDWCSGTFINGERFRHHSDECALGRFLAAHGATQGGEWVSTARGEWWGDYKCSRCGKKITIDAEDDLPKPCNCGATPKGEKGTGNERE